MSELRIDGFVSGVEFKAGLKLKLSTGDVLAVIGPNNSGKSATLRELSGLLREGGNRKVLQDVTFERVTPIEEIQSQLNEFVQPNGWFNVPGHSFMPGQLTQWWGPAGKVLGAFLTEQLVCELSTRDRLSDCDPQPPFRRRERFAAKHPFHFFFRDETLEQRASSLFRKAFNKDLIIHRGASIDIPAYVGQKPSLSEGESTSSTSYFDRLELLDKLEEQGDGMRSFTSILGRTLAEDKPILLIDEPEAFLHPPQARLLADTIASETTSKQVFVATHSSDVLQGLLSSHGERVSIVRLARTEFESSAVLLPSQQVVELWKDPILRFSNVLDGLFHDAVVITESDADCRFYEAMTQTTESGHLPDIHYTYSGGKDRLPVVIRALKGLGVPVVTVADFDVLNNEPTLSKIVDALGGKWSAIKPIWQTVKDAVERTANFVGATQFKKELHEIVKGIPGGGSVEKSTLSRVKSLARNASAWDNAKLSGLSSLPNGEPTLAAKKLLEELKTLGLFVIPQGEMEGFYRAEAAHGPRWVERVLRLDLQSDPDLRDAREFAALMVDYLRTNVGFAK